MSEEIHELSAKEAVGLYDALVKANAAKARFEALCAEALKSRGLEPGEWVLNLADAELRRNGKEDGDGK